MDRKFQTFTDLHAWKEGHSLALEVYRATASFPQKETFALVNQMRRSSISITSNVAEGFSHRSRKEKIQFYSMSLGSLTELQNQLLIAADIGYLEAKLAVSLQERSTLVHKLLNGLIKAIKNS